MADLTNFLYSSDLSLTIVNVVAFLGLVEFIGALFGLVGSHRR